MREFILASRSPRRIKILEDAGYDFKVVPSHIDEHLDDSLPLIAAIKKLAQDKAEAVAQHHPEAVILAADTLVSFKGQVIGKPQNKAEARAMLKQFSGETQEVITAYCVLYTPSRTILIGADTAQLTFRPLSDEEIEEYIATEEPYDKAGAYNIEETARAWVEKIEGLRSTITALPIEQVRLKLESVGIVPKG